VVICLILLSASAVGGRRVEKVLTGIAGKPMFNGLMKVTVAIGGMNGDVLAVYCPN
jgi:hypothetical protein